MIIENEHHNDKDKTGRARRDPRRATKATTTTIAIALATAQAVAVSMMARALPAKSQSLPRIKM